MTWLPNRLPTWKRLTDAQREAIRIAASGQHPDELLQIVKDKPWLVNQEVDQLGQTLLHVLAANQHAQHATALILDYGADPFIRDKEHCTCVHVCCRHGNTDLLVEVLGAAAEKYVAGGPTARYAPAEECNKQRRVEIKRLIRIPNKEGKTCLLVACVHNHTEVVETLMRYGASPAKDNRDKEGNTALHYAVFNRNVEMVRLLFKDKGTAGLVHTKNKSGQTPLNATNDQPKIRELLLATHFSPSSSESPSIISSFASSVGSKESDRPGATHTEVSLTILAGPSAPSPPITQTTGSDAGPSTSQVAAHADGGQTSPSRPTTTGAAHIEVSTEVAVPSGPPAPSLTSPQTTGSSLSSSAPLDSQIAAQALLRKDFFESFSATLSGDHTDDQLQVVPPAVPEAHIQEMKDLKAKLRQYEEDAHIQATRIQDLEAQKHELSLKLEQQMRIAAAAHVRHEETVAGLAAKLQSSAADAKKLESTHHSFLQAHGEQVASLVQEKEELKKLEAQARAERDKAASRLKQVEDQYEECREELLQSRDELRCVRSELDNAKQKRSDLMMAMHAFKDLELNADGDTPLHLACRKNQPGPVAWFMAAGADAMQTNRNGVAAWQEAMKHPAVLKVVLEHKPELKCKALLTACAAQDESVVKFLLQECRACPNIVDQEGARLQRGDTPLHDACRKAAIGIAKLLLEAGAQKAVRNADGKKPAMLAHEIDDEQTCWAVLELFQPRQG